MSEGRDPHGRFAPGHKHGLVGRPGRDKETRRRLRSLAIVLRESWPPEQIAWWLREVAAGRDPDRPRPEGAAPIDWAIRMRAVKMYLERALGLPPQHLHLEAEVRAVEDPTAPSADAFAALEPAARDALRDGLRALLGQPAAGDRRPTRTR